MRFLIAFCVAAVFSLSCINAKVFAQDALGDLSEEQMSEGKKLREEYSSEKEGLEMQLQKLIKDRDIAVKDKNASLVERRNREIKQTREKIKNLPQEYSGQFSDMLSDEQKEKKISDDFYEKEMKAELEKMKKAEAKENEKEAAKKPKPAAKKK
ncbi:MAG: hypothetical protein FWH43_03305 [Endomicrobia bacterium]|nr:hypothetical protein [Endomicrobiia bacterium]